METLQFEYRNGRPRRGARRRQPWSGVVGSGNLEVLVEPAELGGACAIEILTAARRLRRDLAGGAGRLLRPPSAGRRAHLHQRRGRHARRGQPAAGPGGRSLHRRPSHEAQLLRGQCPRTPRSVCSTPAAFARSCRRPNAWSARTWRQLDAPAAFDDGIIVGRGTLDGNPVLVAAQEGGFMGGAVGEVHGAKLVGLLRARPRRAAGRRAAAGRIRRRAPARGQRRPDRRLRGDARGAGRARRRHSGGRARSAASSAASAAWASSRALRDAVVMSEEGRLGLSGPEVIETTMGVEEFDSRDRALVWRTTGGKHRYLLGECSGAGGRRPGRLPRGGAVADRHQARPVPGSAGGGARPPGRAAGALRRLP